MLIRKVGQVLRVYALDDDVVEGTLRGVQDHLEEPVLGRHRVAPLALRVHNRDTLRLVALRGGDHRLLVVVLAVLDVVPDDLHHLARVAGSGGTVLVGNPRNPKLVFTSVWKLAFLSNLGFIGFRTA